MKKPNFKNLKTPESKGVLAEKTKLGRPPKQNITASIRVGMTEAEKDKIIKLAVEQGRSYSQMVWILLKQGGHI